MSEPYAIHAPLRGEVQSLLLGSKGGYVMSDWLPEELDYNSFGGQWEPFVTEVHRIFCRDFIESKAAIQGQQLKINRQLDQGREKTFWHLVTRNYQGHGREEDDRMVDIPRAKKLPWVRAILDALAIDPKHKDIRFWVVPEDRNAGRRETKYKIALADFSYLIVIGVKNIGLVMVTAFPLEFGNYRRKVEQEYKKWKGQ